jgi:hypothetical protein
MNRAEARRQRHLKQVAESYWKIIITHVSKSKVCRNEPDLPQNFQIYHRGDVALQENPHKTLTHNEDQTHCEVCDNLLHCECPLEHEGQRYFTFKNMQQHLVQCKSFQQSADMLWEYFQGRRDMPMLFKMDKQTDQTTLDIVENAETREIQEVVKLQSRINNSRTNTSRIMDDRNSFRKRIYSLGNA